MFEDYTRAHGDMKEKIPVYFYLIPDITPSKAIELAQRRTRHHEAEPRVLMVKTQDIEDSTNVTFTLDDSHTSYRRRISDAGLTFGGHVDVPVDLPDHGKIFPFSMIAHVHHVYAARRIRYEIPMWDRRMLERLPYRLLGSG